MKNLVLAVDDDVLDDVRKYATNRATTVNAIAWEHLTRIAMEEDKAACTHESLAGLGRPSPSRLAPSPGSVAIFMDVEAVVDTNVLVYSVSHLGKVSRKAGSSRGGVLQKFYVNVTRKIESVAHATDV